MADQPTPIDEMLDNLDNLIVNLHALARDDSSSIYVKMQRLIDQTHALAICVQDTRRRVVRPESAPVRSEPWATCVEPSVRGSTLCNWNGPATDLAESGSGYVYCPNCGSQRIRYEGQT